jgi:predicted ATP-grasp superfamily ATP-dependent carboligase
LAVSAARAGYQVTAIDAFGDRDLRASARVIGAPQSSRFDPHAAALSAADVAADLVAYTANLENYPAEVGRLAIGRRLLGNPPDVLMRVRNPIELMRVLRRAGFSVPTTRATATPALGGDWLLKPRRSGGGHGVSAWQCGDTVPRSSYLQERIDGTPGSVVFAANGHDAKVLGLSRQLVGDIRFGARDFRYCGSLLAGRAGPLFPQQSRLAVTAKAMARVIALEFGLVGLNGIDFMARSGVPYPVEVNPRYSASMELIERAWGTSLFELHARACEGKLPAEIPVADLIEGKAVVFARGELVMRETGSWLGNESFADVPHSGEHIESGRPICTVLARARSAGACMRRLTRLAGTVYRSGRPVTQRAA